MTPNHEKTGMKTKRKAAPGLQDRREPLSAAVTPLKPLKLRMEPKLTAAQKQKRLDFAKAHINWSIRHWRRVPFIDESPFELFHPPNHRNDRAWSGDSSEVPITNNVKRPAKATV